MNCLLVEPTEAYLRWPGTPVDPILVLGTILVAFIVDTASFYPRNQFLDDEAACPEDLFINPCYMPLAETIGPLPPYDWGF